MSYIKNFVVKIFSEIEEKKAGEETAGFPPSRRCFLQSSPQKRRKKAMSQQHTKSEKRARRKRYEARVRARIAEAKAAAKK